ncbi:hypothetical protein GA0115255_1222511 [Streptomyces sp. Ncost-T6T-2b]|nr:hypothetical protein GA0115255_1222511 [Streptomyces sp. Ncost-T6T-2b]
MTTTDPTVPAPSPEPMHRLRFEEPGPPRPTELPGGTPAWRVSRYADVRQVLSDPRFGRAQLVRPPTPRPSPTYRTSSTTPT